MALLAVAALLISRAAAGRRSLEHEPKPPLHGSWTIEQLTVDGVTQPPGGGVESWRRLVFDSRQRAAVQLADGRWQRYDWWAAGGEVEIAPGPGATPVATLRTRRNRPSRFDVEGSIGGRPVTAVLRREEPRFLLVERGFSWVREVPAI